MSKIEWTDKTWNVIKWGDCEKKIKSMQGIDNDLLHKIENTKQFPKN